MTKKKAVTPARRRKMRELFGRIAGNHSTDAWLAWLNIPNKDLENKTPREVIKERGNKGAQIIIDLLEDTLSGQPS